jgi:hypothetical protein
VLLADSAQWYTRVLSPGDQHIPGDPERQNAIGRNQKCQHVVAQRIANGEQCKNASLAGATVCRYHAGAATQVVHAARIRLQNAADKMARELLGMATDPSVSDSVKLAAIRDALDRAGLKPVTAVDLEVQPNRGKRFSRESRRSLRDNVIRRKHPPWK